MEEYGEESKDSLEEEFEWRATRGKKDWSMRETRWNKIIEGKSIEEGFTAPAISYLSKFLIHKATITFEEIEREWANWDEKERWDFLSAYMEKHPVDEEDFRIIEYIMEHAGPWEVCVLPQIVNKLPDKKRVLRYLLERIDEVNPEEIAYWTGWSMGNFYVQIENMGDPEAIPVLKKKISEMLDYPGLYEKGHHIQGGYYNKVAIEFIDALEALCKLEPRDDYRKLLEGFKMHPNENVARSATKALTAIRWGIKGY